MIERDLLDCHVPAGTDLDVDTGDERAGVPLRIRRHSGVDPEAAELRRRRAEVGALDRGPGTVKRTVVTDDPNVRGFLKAVDPMTGKAKWATPYKSPNFSSIMSQAICRAALAVRLALRVCSIHKTPRSIVNSISCISR